MAVIYIGTVGQSVFRSTDGGDSFRLACHGMLEENEIRALVVDPRDPRVVFAGADDGLFRTDDGGESWRPIPSAMDGRHIWSLAFAAHDPDTMFAGTGPAGMFRSSDRGETWEACAAELAQGYEHRQLVTRVTAIAPDPRNPRVVYAGIEADGVRKSVDGGRAWKRIGDGLDNDDIHDIKVLGDGTLLATTNTGIYRSRDAAASWHSLEIDGQWPWRYCRGLSVTADRVFVGVGNGAPGDQGAMFVTEDAGDSWRSVPLHAPVNSTIWQFATGGSWMFASTISGQLFRSTNGGRHWGKVAREFGEIRGLVCVA